jgi:hypothetical protein
VRDVERGQRTSIVTSSVLSPSSKAEFLPGARRRPPRCRCGCDTASDPPPRARSPHRQSSSRWKSAPFFELCSSCPIPLILSIFSNELCLFDVRKL